MNRGAFSHGHRWVTGHAGEVASTVFVHRGDGQEAPGGHPLPVGQHLLRKKEKKRKERLNMEWS